MQPVLGQPVPRTADRRSLHPDAGVAPACRRHQLRSCSGLDAPRTVAETGRPRGGLGTPHGAASARVVPVSSRLPASGAGTRSLAGIARLGGRKPHFPLSRKLRIRKAALEKPATHLWRDYTGAHVRNLTNIT